MPQNALIQVRADTSANWATADPVLEDQELAYDTTEGRFKVGDGATAWTSLPFTAGAAVTSIVGITGTLAEFNAALTGADFATGGGTATGTNTGDQTTITGNAGTATALQTARNINGVAFDGTANITINAVDSTARVPETRTITTTAPLTGGGDLSANRTLAISPATGSDPGSMSAADKTKLDAITGTNTGDQTITLTGDVTGSGTGSFATTINASFYKAGGTDVALADGGTGASLSDPNADRILFWDDSAGQMTWLTLGTNLSITGTTLDAAGGGGLPDGDYGDVVASGTGTVLTVESAAGNFTVTDDLTVNGGDALIQSDAGAKLTLKDTADVNFVNSRTEYSHVDGYSIIWNYGVGHYFYVGGSQIAFIGGNGVRVDTGPLTVGAASYFLTTHIASPTTPPADHLVLAPQRLNASGGRVIPRWKSEDGVAMSMASHPGRNSIAYAQAIGTNAVLVPVGMIALTAVGTATARTRASTSRLTRARRLGYVSSATAGNGAGLHNTVTASQNLFTTGGVAGGGFSATYRFAVSDASLVAGAHSVIGMRAMLTPIITTSPATLTDIIACCQIAGGANWHICYGGSAAQTPVDTGMAVNNTDLLEFIIHARPDVNNKVTWRLENISTGAVASGELTGTAGTALPANTTFLGPLIWRSNNATAAAVGIDIVGYCFESDFA